MEGKLTNTESTAGWDDKTPTPREELALWRAQAGDPTVQDLLVIENLCRRCFDDGCAIDLKYDEETGRRRHNPDECPEFCFVRDATWREWGLL